jgi:hypothetical protein
MKAVGYPTRLSNLKILLDYNKPGAKFAEKNTISFLLRGQKRNNLITFV